MSRRTIDSGPDGTRCHRIAPDSRSPAHGRRSPGRTRPSQRCHCQLPVPTSRPRPPAPAASDGRPTANLLHGDQYLPRPDSAAPRPARRGLGFRTRFNGEPVPGLSCVPCVYRYLRISWAGRERLPMIDADMSTRPSWRTVPRRGHDGGARGGRYFSSPRLPADAPVSALVTGNPDEASRGCSPSISAMDERAPHSSSFSLA